MAGCSVIIQFPIEVFKILKGCIRAFKPICWERTIPLAYLLAVDGECADSDEMNSLFEITH